MNASFPHPRNPLVISMVSHGHAPLVQPFLEALARLSAATVSRVVLTHNLPEDDPREPPGGWPFTLQIRRNARPMGFGANHNRALADASEPFVCVLNPDVALPYGDPFAALVQAADAAGVGCAYPMQVDAAGQVQDSERTLPTPLALWRRRVLRQLPRAGAPVEWVNGACMVLPRTVWEAVDGFDEGYFMYCEDVDLCLRTLELGWRILYCPQATLLHHESKTRGKSVGFDPHPEDSAAFVARWREWLQRGDPYFSPAFSPNHTTWVVQDPLHCTLELRRRVYQRPVQAQRQVLRHSP